MAAAPLTKQQQATQAFLLTPLDPSLTDGILGNAPVSVKELPVKWLAIFRSRGNGYCADVAEKLKVTEVSIGTSAEDALKLEGMTACEVEVTPDMCTPEGVVHQGVIMFLIDECSTLAMVTANAGEGRNAAPGVSCTINALFHGTALSGVTLRIVSRSLAVGHESNSARVEVWDKKNHKLIASGGQMTMPPSLPGKWMK